jgi:hypothetical protein
MRSPGTPLIRGHPPNGQKCDSFMEIPTNSQLMSCSVVLLRDSPTASGATFIVQSSHNLLISVVDHLAASRSTTMWDPRKLHLKFSKCCASSTLHSMALLTLPLATPKRLPLRHLTLEAQRMHNPFATLDACGAACAQSFLMPHLMPAAEHSAPEQHALAYKSGTNTQTHCHSNLQSFTRHLRHLQSSCKCEGGRRSVWRRQALSIACSANATM